MDPDPMYQLQRLLRRQVVQATPIAFVKRTNEVKPATFAPFVSVYCFQHGNRSGAEHVYTLGMN